MSQRGERIKLDRVRERGTGPIKIRNTDMELHNSSMNSWKKSDRSVRQVCCVTVKVIGQWTWTAVDVPCLFAVGGSEGVPAPVV